MGASCTDEGGACVSLRLHPGNQAAAQATLKQVPQNQTGQRTARGREEVRTACARAAFFCPSSQGDVSLGRLSERAIKNSYHVPLPLSTKEPRLPLLSPLLGSPEVLLCSLLRKLPSLR